MKVQTVLRTAASLVFAIVVLGGVVHGQTAPTLTPSLPMPGAPVPQPTLKAVELHPVTNQPMAVQATDFLERTRWSNDDDIVILRFRKGGVLEVNDLAEDELIAGKYSRLGDSVEMTFKNYGRASATISGNKMTVKFTYANGATSKFVLNKE